MPLRPLVALGVALLLIAPLVPARAQESQPPLVVFIEDQQLQTSSVLDPGPDGVTRLEQIFQSYGARTRWLTLSDPLPKDTAVIVIVRPLRALAVDQLARLWVQLTRGSNLLLAIDPNGLNSTRSDRSLVANTDKANSGLSILLDRYYGIRLDDTFVVAPWFSHGSITSQLTTFSYVHFEDFAPHPVTGPLTALRLPALVWGARTLTVEPLGLGSRAAPLLYTLSGYGETNTKVFAQTEPAPLEVNLGQDRIGRLLIGALGENAHLGSRVVVFGDSEIVQNGYGLDINSRTQAPLHWGNRLLTERAVAWLLGLPEEEWPGLPEGYTWLAVDGGSEDWPENTLELEDRSDAPIARYDIQRVSAFRDSSYLYLRVETAQPPPSVVRLTVGIENTFDGITDVTFALDEQRMMAQDSSGTFLLPDGAFAVGDVIEARLPLRVAGEGGLVSAVCLADRRTDPSSAPLDCTDHPPAIVPVARTQAPVETWHVPMPLVMVYSTQAEAVNLRAQPSTDSAVLDVLVNGRTLAAVGRTESGEWVQVQNAQVTGWLAAFVVRANVEIQTLPVVAP